MAYSKGVDHGFESKVDFSGSDDFGDVLDMNEYKVALVSLPLGGTDTGIIGL